MRGSAAVRCGAVAVGCTIVKTRLEGLEMRVAYLIMLHNNFPQVRWIVNAIYNSEAVFIIHITTKADHNFCRQVTECLGSQPNVKYLPRRHVNRFGWSLVETELRAI